MIKKRGSQYTDLLPFVHVDGIESDWAVTLPLWAYEFVSDCRGVLSQYVDDEGNGDSEEDGVSFDYSNNTMYDKAIERIDS